MARRRRGGGFLSNLVLAGTVGVLGYRYLVGPWHRRWGATVEEAAAPMPGDAMVSEANFQTTRAINISARPEDVWPWLVQMGQGKGGLYSYTALENKLGLGFENADRIVPEWQDLKVGDIIALEPGGTGYTVVELEPNRRLVLFADLTQYPGMEQTEGASTWVFTLQPVDEQHTRLVVRWRARFLGQQSRDPRAMAIGVALEPVEFVMERKMLLGIRERAEARHPSM